MQKKTGYFERLGKLEVCSEEKMFKIRPEIPLWVQQVENGLYVDIAAWSNNLGVRKGWVHLRNTEATDRSCREEEKACKIRLGIGKGQKVQSFVNHVNLIVPKFIVKLATFRKCIGKEQE